MQVFAGLDIFLRDLSDEGRTVIIINLQEIGLRIIRPLSPSEKEIEKPSMFKFVFSNSYLHSKGVGRNFWAYYGGHKNSFRPLLGSRKSCLCL